MGICSYYDRQLSRSILENLYEQHQTGDKCDLVLETENGDSFTVHKWVLVSSSSFFKTMLNSEFDDKNSNTVAIRRCSSSSILKKIIEYMYTGKIELSLQFVKDILDTSLFLGLDNLTERCTQFLADAVNTDNCFELLDYAETFYGKMLINKCIQVIIDNFDELMSRDDFDKISIDSIKVLVKQERELLNEENLYLGISKWLMYDIENRKEFISVLLNEIKFEHFTHEFLASKILENSPLLKYESFMMRIISMTGNFCKWQFSMSRRNNKIIETESFEPLYAILSDQIFEISNLNAKYSKRVATIPDNRENTASSVFGDQNIFVCGGEENGSVYSVCNYYSVKENMWTTLPLMNTHRYGHRALTLDVDNKIYVCGGIDDGNEKEIESFDIFKSIWEKKPSLNNSVRHGLFGFCSQGNCIFAVDGINFECLDVREDAWRTLPCRNFKISSAVAYNYNVYAFQYNSISTFDIRNNKWLDSTMPFIKKYNFYLPDTCILNNEVYVFGHENEDSNEYLLQSYKLSDLSSSKCVYMNLPTDKLTSNILSLQN